MFNYVIIAVLVIIFSFILTAIIPDNGIDPIEKIFKWFSCFCMILCGMMINYHIFQSKANIDSNNLLYVVLFSTIVELLVMSVLIHIFHKIM